METAGETIEYRCLVRATDGKKTISTSVSSQLTDIVFFTLEHFMLVCCYGSEVIQILPERIG